MLRKWRITYRTLSPVHIKGQRPDYGSGILRLGRKGYVIDEIKLSKLLQKEGLIDLYVDYVSQCLKARREPSLAFFFNQHRDRIQLNIPTLKQISSGIATVGNGNSFICDGMGNYFIPGTSIKGAIRTSLLYHLLKELKDSSNENFKDVVVSKIEHKLKDYSEVKNAYINAKRQNNRREARQKSREMDHIKKSFDEEIVENEFLNFFNDLAKKGMVKVGPNTDLLRTVKVSDSKIDRIRRENIKVVCFRSNGSFYFGKTRQRNKPEREIFLNYECFHEDTEFTVEILLDLELLSKFYPDGMMLFNDISSLISIIKEFGDHQWTAERNFFQKVRGLQKITNFYNQNIPQPLLRVGWGTGMLGTTIDLLLDPSLRQRIRNEVMGHDRPGLPAPHSKRVVMRDNQPTFPLGWTKIDSFKEV